jgi:pyruvate dehydrogenase E1 component alpha subunit
LSQRGNSFGIPGEQVDGMDVRAVHAAAEKRSSIAAPARGRSFSKC